MDDNKDDSKKRPNKPLLPEDYIEGDKKIEDRDKNVNEILSEYNTQRGFFKRIEEVINMISGLFKGLMK